jgi:hypothetical protein
MNRPPKLGGKLGRPVIDYVLPCAEWSHGVHPQRLE